MNWVPLTPQTFALGESPFWHPHEQMLYWVDIPGKQVLRANIYMGTVQAWDMPSEPGCIAPAHSGGLVIALRHGRFRAREWEGELEPVATLPYDRATVRANDGKCDARGRFWVGTIDETKSNRAAALYSLDCRNGEAVMECKVDNVLTANGLAWSPDGKTLYWADTPSHAVRAWDFDLASTSMASERVFLQRNPKPGGWTFDQQAGYGGRPDGAAVDVQGNYFVAMYEGACLCQFAPDGTLLAEIPTPVMCPTMPCFGGEDLRTLYITSARQGRSKAELEALPESGCVFSVRVEVPGLPVNFFVD